MKTGSLLRASSQVTDSFDFQSQEVKRHQISGLSPQIGRQELRSLMRLEEQERTQPVLTMRFGQLLLGLDTSLLEP